MGVEVVSLAEIRKWAEIGFDLLERGKVQNLDLNRDYRWQVYFAEAFELPEPELVTGSLHDDVDELRGIVDRLAEGEPEAVWHFLLHLTGVITALSKQALDDNLCIELGEPN